MSDHRNTIFVEDCEILDHQVFEGSQFVLQLKSEQIAANSLAGQFVHVQCHARLPMRRPFSIMRSSDNELQLLYKVVGEGSLALSETKVGDRISVMGPIGNPFSIDSSKTLPLLIGGGVGIPPMIFLAQTYQSQFKQIKPFVIMGSEVPFPFQTRPSNILVDGMPEGVIAAMPLMEDWGFPSRLASMQNYVGCHNGYVTDVARHWLTTLDKDSIGKVIIYSCGPHVMLESVHKLAEEFTIPCQISLEEYMACGIGGCAGCTVPIQKEGGDTQMKRVCVDGPVFASHQVFF